MLDYYFEITNTMSSLAIKMKLSVHAHFFLLDLLERTFRLLCVCISRFNHTLACIKIKMLVLCTLFII